MATLGMFSFLAALKYRWGLAKQLVKAARNSGACMQTNPSLESLAQAVPAEAYLYWKKDMAKAYPKRRFDDSDWIDSCLGLLVHFRMLAEDAGKAKHGLALASVSALSVWKSWEAGAPLDLEKFLRATIGGASVYVGQCPPDAYGWAPRALADAWALAHAMERIDVRTKANAAVPLVFAVDKAIRMPGGLAFFRDTFEPLGGHYRVIDDRTNITLETYAADILSESFLYDDPHAETPAQALKTSRAKLPFGSRALAALHALLARSNTKRATKINPTKQKKASRPENNHSPSYLRSNDDTTTAPAVFSMALLSDSSAASSSSSSGSSCSSSSGSSCSSSSGSSCDGSC